MTISNINFTTTRIEIIQSGSIIGSATGFFFRHNDIKYFVTNRHVVIDEDNNHTPDILRVTLHMNRQDLSQNIAVNIQLYDDSNPLWLQHPNYGQNKCDVVLIPLNEKTLHNVDFKYFNSTSITFIGSEIINKRDINSFADVVIIGYPLGFHDTLNNLPVYRKASVASCYGVGFNGLPYFLVDANLHPGTSGSPVVNTHHTLFREKYEGYVLFGVHSAEHIVDKDPLGLNVVWYAHLLVEIANQSQNL